MSLGSVHDQSMIVEVDGVVTTVETQQERDRAWVNIHRDHSWEFCVEDRAATLETTDSGESYPDWLDELLREIGIEEVHV